MIFDINNQMLLAQINNLYRSEGTYGMYDLVYDQLVVDGFEIDIPKDIKDTLKKKAKDKFVADEQRVIKSWPEAKQKELFYKYVKSAIVAKYLMDKVPTEGCLIITDENTGKQIKFINIVGYVENTK